MRKFAMAGLALVVFAGMAVLAAEEKPKMPEMPGPEKEHAWLQQFVGEWEAMGEMFMEPGKPPQKSQGTESVRAIGGFWVLSDFKGTFMDKPFTGVFTLGFDPEKKKYVGTWIDSMGSYLWKYEGTLDATGKILTFEAEGPCPMAPGKMFKFKDVIELKSKDHRILTSSMQGEDGKWTTMMTIHYQRK